MTGVKQISDFKMERYLLGELPEQEMRELREREATDEIFAARVKSMREENAKILAENPFAVVEEKLESGVGDCFAPGARNDESRAEASRTHSFIWLKIAAALVVALGLFSAVYVNRDVVAGHSENASMEVAMLGDEAQAGAADTRIKGLSARIEVWKKTADSAVQLSNLDEAREGDEIQLRYSVPEKCFGMLFSLDGNGTVTMHMADDNRAIELAPGKMTTLPFAYKLDNAPKFEKFFLLTSGKEFSVDVGNLDALLKDKDIHAESVNLRKVEGK